MPSLEYLADYFTTPHALALLAGLVSVELASCGIFMKFPRPSVRLLMLATIFGSTLSLWLFVASSLVLCEVYDHLYPSHTLESEVKAVLGWATMVALGLGVPLATLVSLRSARVLVRGLPVTQPSAPLRRAFDEVRALMDEPGVSLVAVRGEHPTCFSVGVREKTVVVSDSLAQWLNPQELRSIIAHEIAHLKHGDTKVKALLSVYARVLPFDPVIRLVRAAAQREMECRADDRVVTILGWAAPLISGLVQLDRMRKRSSRPALSFASHLLASHPPIDVRIGRLRRS